MRARKQFILPVSFAALLGCSVQGDMTPVPGPADAVKTVDFAGDTLVLRRAPLAVEVSGSWRGDNTAYLVVRVRNQGDAALNLPLASSELVDPTEDRWKLRVERRNGESGALAPGQEAVYDLVFRSERSDRLVGRIVEVRLALDGSSPERTKFRFDKSHKGWF